MRIKKTITLLLVPVLLLVAAACGSGTGAGPEDGKINIAVSILPQKTFVEAVCGSLASVSVLVPPGYSPELYEPTPQEMAEFSKADIYFSIGVPVEESGALGALSENTRLVSLDEACRGVYPELEIDHGRDPHIWLSIKRVIVMVQTIAEELSAHDPENAETYSKNASDYIAALQAADSEIRDILSGLRQRSFIVFHPAFGYFADEYSLEMHALEEHGKEATAAGLMEMTDFAKEQGIGVIFYQAEVDSSQSAAFADEIGGVAVMLDPLSENYIANLKSMARAIAEGA